MFIFLSVLIVIACLLLVGAVLIQKSKGGGLSADFQSGNQVMGYRKTTDFIEKATWGLAIFICVLSIVAAFAVKTPKTVSSIAPEAQKTTAPAAAPSNNANAAATPAATGGAATTK